MRRLTRFTLIAVAVVAVAFVAPTVYRWVVAPPSTHFTLTASELHSSDATTQARVALERFFNALGSGHDAAANAMIVAERRPTDGWNVKSLVVESIEPVSVGPPGDGDLTSDKSGTVRTFYAPVRMWPGDGSFIPNETLNWTWTMERGADGVWRVWGWGMD